MTTVTKIRKKSFYQSYPYDKELGTLCENHSHCKFLFNPSSQLIYIYLTHFIKNLSQEFFDLPLSEIEILEWGCGKGQTTYLLNKLKCKVTSCDLLTDSPDSTFGQFPPLITNKNINVLPLKSEIELPFDDAQFHVVLSVGVLEHVQNDQKSLKEINRILKPNGLFFCFNLPYFFSWTQRLSHLLGDHYHDRLYSKKKIRKLLAENQLTLLDIWHRQLLPKNRMSYLFYKTIERVDLWLTEYTPFKHLVTSIEFIARKG